MKLLYVLFLTFFINSCVSNGNSNNCEEIGLRYFLENGYFRENHKNECYITNGILIKTAIGDKRCKGGYYLTFEYDSLEIVGITRIQLRTDEGRWDDSTFFKNEILNERVNAKITVPSKQPVCDAFMCECEGFIFVESIKLN